jgi:ubiquinone biosynthesis protein
LARWVTCGAQFAAGLLVDRLRRERQLPKRLRLLFEQVGGTAVKLGQQLSLRSDLLPKDVCDELASLTDDVPPIPRASVTALLEAALGCPLDEVFARVDLDAMGSGSVACVYQAWLKSGERVAVKLRRPEVAERFAADLAAMDLVFWLAEAMALVRSGLFNHLRLDLRTLLGEETSLVLEARYQRRFRRALRRANLPWIHVPRIYADLSSDSVLVSEFVEGVPLTELLVAKESRPDRLAELAARGIDATVVAERIVFFGLWARFEAIFFHADPHPGNLFVRADSEIVIFDFGACGSTSSQTMRNRLEVVRHLVRGDSSAISGIMLADLSPLPRFDSDAFRREMDIPLRALVTAIEDRDSHWSERMVASVWLYMLEVTRRFQLRINLDTIRSMRAFLLYDTIAFRLDPTLSEEILERYMHQVAERRKRQLRRALARVRKRPGFPLVDILGLLERGQTMASDATLRIETAHHQFSSVARKSVLAVRAALDVLLTTSVLGVALELRRALEATGAREALQLSALVGMVMVMMVLLKRGPFALLGSFRAILEPRLDSRERSRR